jgi:hypothetical protein
MGGNEVSSPYVARRSGTNMRNCFVEIRTTVTVVWNVQPKETKSVSVLYFEFVHCGGVLILTPEQLIYSS